MLVENPKRVKCVKHHVKRFVWAAIGDYKSIELSDWIFKMLRHKLSEVYQAKV